jgi:hypothetical protein
MTRLRELTENSNFTYRTILLSFYALSIGVGPDKKIVDSIVVIIFIWSIKAK